MKEAEAKARELVHRFLGAISHGASDFEIVAKIEMAKVDAERCADIIATELISIRKPEYVSFVTNYAKESVMDGYERVFFWREVIDEIKLIKSL